jgi:hypothetical protein
VLKDHLTASLADRAKLHLEIASLRALFERNPSDELKGRVAQVTEDMHLALRRHDEKNQEQIKQNQAKIRDLEEQLKQPRTGDAG